MTIPLFVINFAVLLTPAAMYSEPQLAPAGILESGVINEFII